MGARARHRALTLYSPCDELLGWMIILGVCSGLLLVAHHEAASAGDSGWASVFFMLLVLDLIAYWWAVVRWMDWLN